MWFVGSGEHNLHFSEHVRIDTPRGYNYESFGMMGADLPVRDGILGGAGDGLAAEVTDGDARFTSSPAARNGISSRWSRAMAASTDRSAAS